MSRDRVVTVTLERVIEIDVEVALYDGTGPTWFDPGTPDEASIREARLSGTPDTVELSAGEIKEAIERAWHLEPELEPEPECDPDPDDENKPF